MHNRGASHTCPYACAVFLKGGTKERELLDARLGQATFDDIISK